MKEDSLFYKFFYCLFVLLFFIGCGLLIHFGIEMGFWKLFRFFSIIILACSFISFLFFILIQVICDFISIFNRE